MIPTAGLRVMRDGSGRIYRCRTVILAQERRLDTAGVLVDAVRTGDPVRAAVV